MAEADGRKPQVVDPEVVAGLQRVLTIRGPMGVLDVLDLIVPVVIMGQVETAEVIVRTPSFRPTDVFTNGPQVAPALGAVLADTGPLPAGSYDVQLYFSQSSDQSANDRTIDLEHRDAANAANLMTMSFNLFRTLGGQAGPMQFGYELELNERLRFIMGVASAAGELWVATIFARVR